MNPYIKSIKASSYVKPFKGYTFLPSNINDGQLDTCWQSHQDKSEKIWLEIEFKQKTYIDNIEIANGFEKYDDEFGDLYQLNNRIKKATLTFNNNLFDKMTIYFKDLSEISSFLVNKENISSIRLDVDEVFLGTKWNDLSVSEIVIWGRVDSNTIELPLVKTNTCPSEGCQYGKWTTEGNLDVYSEEGNTSNIFFSLRSNEQFTAIKGDVYIEKAGLVYLNSDYEDNRGYKYSKGKYLYLLSYISLGEFYIWYNGKIFPSGPFWNIPIDKNKKISHEEYINTPKIGNVLYYPTMNLWVSIKSKTGKKGWIVLHTRISRSEFKFIEKIKGIDRYGD